MIPAGELEEPRDAAPLLARSILSLPCAASTRAASTLFCATAHASGVVIRSGATIDLGVRLVWRVVAETAASAHPDRGRECQESRSGTVEVDRVEEIDRVRRGSGRGPPCDRRSRPTRRRAAVLVVPDRRIGAVLQKHGRGLGVSVETPRHGAPCSRRAESTAVSDRSQDVDGRAVAGRASR